ncbi:putative ribonuclease H-like domain-containing protein [Tanacetum coccineum]|uniref:Ribonuclease H-like domain-containing protein n=1 Tax=Tanacetum coccineum TaxID=301880 RepID=A0ABQ5AHX8_9ASTR
MLFKSADAYIPCALPTRVEFGSGPIVMRLSMIITFPNPVVEVFIMGAEATRMAVAFGPPTMSWKKKWRRVSFFLPSWSDAGDKLVEKVWDSATRRMEKRKNMRAVEVVVDMVKIDKFIFPVDFVILDIVEDNKTPIIPGRPMLATAHARIDVFGRKISLEVGKEKDYPHRALKNKGIIDSGCSKHMTGNKAYLAEFQDFNGGPVAFKRLVNAYSTGKGKNKIGQQEANQNAGTEEIIDVGDSDKEDESAQDCFVLPIWPSYSSTITTTDDKREGPREEEQVFMDDLERLKRQEKEANEEAEALRKKFEHLVIKEGAAKPSSTNIFSTVSTPAKASSTNLVNTVSLPVSTASPHEGLSLSDPTNPEEDDSEIPPLEDIYQNSTDGIFTTSSFDDEEELFEFEIQEGGGVVVRNKARLVAQGHRQEEGIDYDEVFAPVARLEAIRIFLAFASYMGFIVYQMDVKSAFLYGKIDEEVYVSQPPGFLDPKNPQKVYKVVKALYGLHQAPRAWYATLSTFLLKNGYRRGTIDKTLFLKKDKHDIILVQVYVDDIIFGSTKKSWCDEFEALMKSRFQMSSMGELTFFLGLQVKQKADGIFISQDKYVAEILKKFDFANVKNLLYPIETQKPLSVLVLGYLKGKPKLGLWYPRVSSFDLESYSDSDYAGASLAGNPQQEVANFLAGDSFPWANAKSRPLWLLLLQKPELLLLLQVCGQVLWIQNQMLDYGFNFMNTKIYIDNESTICIVKNPVYHSKTKHIAIRHHFIRDAYEKKLIQVLKIHIDDNVADLLTKAFDVSRFQFLVVTIGMRFDSIERVIEKSY